MTFEMWVSAAIGFMRDLALTRNGFTPRLREDLMKTSGATASWYAAKPLACLPDFHPRDPPVNAAIEALARNPPDPVEMGLCLARRSRLRRCQLVIPATT
jgi:hypothetical protein